MAVYTYSLAASDVAAEIPGVDSGSIGASTEPVATGDLDQWITDGASKLNNVLSKAGLTPGSSLDSDVHAAAVEAIKGYAVAKALLVIGVTGDTYQQAWQRWTSVYAEYSNRPQQLGDGYGDGLTISVDDDNKSEKWSFIDSEGSLW